MNIRTLLIAAFTLTLLISCNTKQKPIDQLTDLTENLKANSQDYTEQEWQEVDKQLEQINIELDKYQDQYTDAEKEHIGKLKGTCLWYETQHSVKNLKQGMKDAVKEAKGMIEGFIDAASDK